MDLGIKNDCCLRRIIWNEFTAAIEIMATIEHRTNDCLDVIVTFGRCSFALLIRNRSSATPVGRVEMEETPPQSSEMQQDCGATNNSNGDINLEEP